MNCNSVRKFLTAFVDGQLGIQVSCEVLDHLKMCPACSAIVDHQHSLRRALVRSAEKIVVPADLESRIRRTILMESGTAERAPQSRAGAVGLRMSRVLATAASLVLVVSLAWYYAPAGKSIGTEFIAPDANALSQSDEVTQMIVIRHNQCSKKCDSQSHQLDSLPADRTRIADALDRHFGGTFVAAAPDLTGYGYEFESAAFCNPSRNSDVPAAHVMYVHPGFGTRLSFFSMPRWNGIDIAGAESPDRQHPFIHALRDCEENAVIAWHEGEMTYIIVGRFDAEAMAEMVRDVTLADRSPPDDGLAAAGTGLTP